MKQDKALIFHVDDVPKKLMGSIHTLALQLITEGIIALPVTDHTKIGTKNLCANQSVVTIPMAKQGSITLPVFMSESRTLSMCARKWSPLVARRCIHASSGGWTSLFMLYSNVGLGVNLGMKKTSQPISGYIKPLKMRHCPCIKSPLTTLPSSTGFGRNGVRITPLTR